MTGEATHADFVIVGGGLAGLAAAMDLEDRAIVLERAARPGGLVRADNREGYWFDHVLHLLYCPDPATQARVESLMDGVLAPCPPDAWVETLAGIVRYPFQMHLGALPADLAVRCLTDLARVTFGPKAGPPANFQESLERTFGTAMCETFLFPYNRKMWKRPLDTLAEAGFAWTITNPDFAQVARGVVLKDQDYATYNNKGFYPRPPADAPVRGMECLALTLAAQVKDLRLGHEVIGIDLDTHTITTRHAGQEHAFRFDIAAAATAPLPQLLAMTRQTPHDLRESLGQLTRNRVWSARFAIAGPRPEGRGLWRYYSDESLIFSRLIYMTNFDPGMAPPEGWGLMAEITERAEDPQPVVADLLARVIADLHRVGAVPPGCEIIDASLRVLDPAFVVFTPQNQAVMEAGRAFLTANQVTPLGRYGRWEYTSMGQVMQQGWAWAAQMNAAASVTEPDAPRMM